MNIDTQWSKEIISQAREIELLVLDVDGVMTDGRLHYDAQGGEAKVFHVRDGLGIKQVMDSGIEVGIISGRQSQALKVRLAELGVRQVILGRDDKLLALQELTEQLSMTSLAKVAYVGDDLPDLPAISAAGLGLTVADAHPDVLSAARACTARRGGDGAVREICDLLINARKRTLP